MVERKAIRGKEYHAKASLPWYIRDYEADEMELMGDIELGQLLDDFYGEPAGELNEKAPRETPPFKQLRQELPSGFLYNHAAPIENSIPHDYQSVCKSLDPRLYLKHPFACGCNQVSRFIPAEITHAPSSSTTEAHSHPRSCAKFLHDAESQNKSPAVTSIVDAETTRKITAAELETSSKYEETECNKKFRPPIHCFYPETAENPAAPKITASFHANQESQSRVPSEPENSFNIQDWVHDQL